MDCVLPVCCPGLCFTLTLFAVQMADMQRQMGSLTPAQMQAYQQQAANLSSDDITRARRQMSSMTPDQLKHAASQASANLSAREKYLLDGANSLKASGNQLHSSKQYAAAIEQYNQAKSSLAGIHIPALPACVSQVAKLHADSFTSLH